MRENNTVSNSSAAVLRRPFSDRAQRPFFQKCPLCGKDAVEMLRQRERNGLFVWFECSDPACRAMSLQEFPCE